MSSFKELRIAGYTLPNTHNARKAIIIAADALMSLPPSMSGIKQEDFLNLGTKAGYSSQTIRLGGTRKYFVPADPADSEKEKALSTYGIFFTREKVGRGFLWYPVRENCELLLQHKDEIMQTADSAEKKSENEKLKYVLRTFSEAVTFKKDDVIKPRSAHVNKYSVHMYTLDDLKKSIQYNAPPQSSFPYDERIGAKQLAVITGNTMEAEIKCHEFNAEYWKVRKIPQSRKELMDFISPLVKVAKTPDRDDYLKIIMSYHEVLILGSHKIGYINPIEFRLMKGAST